MKQIVRIPAHADCKANPYVMASFLIFMLLTVNLRENPNDLSLSVDKQPHFLKKRFTGFLWSEDIQCCKYSTAKKLASDTASKNINKSTCSLNPLNKSKQKTHTCTQAAASLQAATTILRLDINETKSTLQLP